MILACPPGDLTDARQRLQAGATSASTCLADSLAAAEQTRSVFLRRFDAGARAQAEAVDRGLAAGLPLPPLAGLAVSVKDLFDVAGAADHGRVGSRWPTPLPATATARSSRGCGPLARR